MLEKYISLCLRHPIQCVPVFITLLPLILILKKKAYTSPAYLYLLIYLVFKLVTDLLMFHCAANRYNNLIIYNVSIPIRYGLLSMMFIYKLESKKLRYSIFGTIVIFALFSFWDIIKANPEIDNLHDHHMVPYASTVECILMILWTMLYFYELIRSMKVPSLLSSTFFWICCGLLLYYSSIVFITPILHYTEKWENPLSLGFVQNISYIFESFYLLFFCFGILNFDYQNYAKQ